MILTPVGRAEPSCVCNRYELTLGCEPTSHVCDWYVLISYSGESEGAVVCAWVACFGLPPDPHMECVCAHEFFLVFFFLSEKKILKKKGRGFSENRAIVQVSVGTTQQTTEPNRAELPTRGEGCTVRTVTSGDCPIPLGRGTRVQCTLG